MGNTGSATLLDIAKLNGNDILVGLIEENLTFAPEMLYFPTRTIKGTQYTTVVRTNFPSVGFRPANGGWVVGKSVFDKRRTECFVFGGVIQVDKAVAQADEQGSADYEMIEASGFVKNSLIKLGSQIWYGGDQYGFTGIKGATPKGGTTVYNAAGTTAATASSVYGVKFGIQDVTVPVGNEAAMTLSDFRDQQLSNDSGATWFPGRVADMQAWMGLQIGNANCTGRICNITADSGKTLNDTILETWLQQFPVGYRPDRVFMSRRSASQLQLSRTVTLFGGGSKVGGDVATVANFGAFTSGISTASGIPITVTDSILNTDAVE